MENYTFQQIKDSFDEAYSTESPETHRKPTASGRIFLEARFDVPESILNAGFSS